MKKVYLSILLCFFAFAGFADVWYSSDSLGLGDAANLNHWWSNADSTGTHPATFAAPGDIWIMETNMMCSTSLTIGGSLFVVNVNFNGPENLGPGQGNLNIGGNLTLSGGAGMGILIESESGDQFINVSGNLNVLDSSYFYNSQAYTIITFNNTSSTLTSPQTMTWTSTNPGEYARITINAGSVVKMLSNVTLPPDAGGSDIVNGALVCDSFVLNCNTVSYPFMLNSGAAVYTGNPGGIDASILNDWGFNYDPGANYVFNGSAPQITGALLPNLFTSGGSVTVSNPAGVSLVQSTTFGDGSALSLGGNLIIGTSELNMGAAALLNGPFTATSKVVTNGTGMLQRQFSADSSYLYPIGDSTNYTPIALTVAGSDFTGGAFVGANVTNHKHPQNGNISNYLNRYWSVSTAGITDPSYTVTAATYVPGDVTGTDADISMGQYTGSLPWMKFGAANTVTQSLSSPAVSNPSSDFTGISTASPTLSVAANASICQSSSAILSVLATTDTPFTYTWAPSTGLSATTGSMVTSTTTSSITYTITVTDANGFTAVDTARVTVNPLPNVYAVTGGGNYCSGTGGVHIGLSGSDTGVGYQLYYMDTVAIGSPAGGTGAAVDFGLDTAAGNYTVVATNTTSGCTSNMDGFANISITPSVVPTVSINASIVDTICEGSLVTYSLSYTDGGDEPSFQWSVNDTVVSGSSFYSFVPANGDVVAVKLTSEAICAIPDTVFDTVVANVRTHATPVVSISATPGDTVCEGTVVTVSAAAGFGGTEPSFTWVKDAVVVSTDSSYTFTPVNGDNVYCVMESNYFCRSATTAYSNVVNMLVEAPVVPSVSLITHPGTYVGVGVEDTLFAVVSHGGASVSYKWYVNGAAVSGVTSSVYSGHFLNNDSVSVVVTNNDACRQSNFTSARIKVVNVDVKQLGSAGSDIQLVPNPNNGNFTVKGTLGSTIADEEISMEITNMLGQVVYKNTTMSQNGSINTQVQTNSTLPAGIYILNLRSGSGNNAIRFVIGK